MRRSSAGPFHPGSDAEVIAASRADGTAFGEIFDRHFRTIHRYLARRVADEADDLASEVFTIAFARRHDYRLDRESALPWLYGIATNLVLARERTRGRQLALVRRLAFVGPAQPSFEDGVDAAVDAGHSVADLQARLDQLSPADRATVLLYAWEELSYPEVAEALGVPVGTVRSRLNRVRRQLREPLAGFSTRTGRTTTQLPEGE